MFATTLTTTLDRTHDLVDLITAQRTAPVGVRRPCAGKLALFFPASDQKTALRNAAVEQAKAICATCPVAETCLADALARDEPDGVWGGQLLRDGVPVPAYVGPGRPRKVPTPVAA